MASGTIPHAVRVGKITLTVGSVSSNPYVQPYSYYYGVGNFSTTYGVDRFKIISVQVSASASYAWWIARAEDTLAFAFGANVGSNWTATVYYEMD